MKVWPAVAFLCLGIAIGALARPAEESLDPLVVCGDTHKLMFENEHVRVMEARVPPGKVEHKHSHPHGLTVYLADYDVEIKTFPDGKAQTLHRTKGTALWSGATVHEVKNVGTATSHAIRIELKK
jgi:quercetin dioxygenase-like cupin family protein